MANTKISDFAAITTLGDTDLVLIAQEDMANKKITGVNIKQSILSIAVLTKTADYTITTADLNKSLRMDAAIAKTFTMCSLGSDEDGDRITLIKQGAGRVTLQMVDSDFVDDSSATGTIYTETLYATITLEYVHGMLRLVIISALGQWITT